MLTRARGRDIYRFVTDLWRANGDLVDNTVLFQDGVDRFDKDAMHDLADLGDVVDANELVGTFASAFTAWAEKRALDDPRRANKNFPNAFAADLVGHLGPLDREGKFMLTRREDCMVVIWAFAKVLEVPETDLVERLAEYYLAHEEEVVEAATEQVRAAREARGGG